MTLPDFLAPRQKRADQIVMDVAAETGIPISKIFSANRTRQIYRARQYAQWRIYRETGMSLLSIGRMFGRDHTSVLNSIRRIDTLMKEAK
ncbi:hypothetical protein BV394_02065 [Brevirhabdus pacifica]|uniref:Chromosomal replication initiator DnaA C-terminal domain-containing protein n=1 Tax=Brevirhabdus pacifica TaxID=1267768 RepID=A0A1U7DFE3_9RHOB|nr:helix-turn-helix domain-containing protein [Brevirhabdus pacifica]APX88665.1 hypothetical protein BV394_02065 [Brevirhabdus pacifica]OWU79934.1 hypothetical protein ATO5_02750 [Loktanella sp. 22II-4b]